MTSVCSPERNCCLRLSFKGAYCPLLSWSAYCSLVLLHCILEIKKKKKDRQCRVSGVLRLCVVMPISRLRPLPPAQLSTPAPHQQTSTPGLRYSVATNTKARELQSEQQQQQLLLSACGAVSNQLQKFCARRWNFINPFSCCAAFIRRLKALVKNSGVATPVA